MADDPYKKYDDYAKQYDELYGTNYSGTNSATHSQDTPTLEQRTEAERRQQIQASAAASFGGIGPYRRGMAGARHLVGSMPLISHIPGISGFANPAEGTQEREDLDAYRTGQPGSARVGRFIGGAAPFMGAASMMPRLLSSFPYSAGVNAGIMGGEEYLSGRNPATGAIAGAMGTVPGWLLGRIITPRLNDAAAATMSAYRDSVTDAQASALQAVASAMGGVSGRSASGRFMARITPEEAHRIMQEAQRRLFEARHPSPQIPPLGGNSENATARAIQNLSQQIFSGAVGIGLGAQHGIHPALAGAIGFGAPYVARGAINAANAGINSVNERLLSGSMPRLIRTPMFRHLNNQVLPDEARSLLMALSSPLASEIGPDVLSSLGYPEAPTLGGQ